MRTRTERASSTLRAAWPATPPPACVCACFLRAVRRCRTSSVARRATRARARAAGDSGARRRSTTRATASSTTPTSRTPRPSSGAPPRLASPPLHAPWRLRPVFVRAAPDPRRAHRHCSGEYCAGDSLTWASVHADLPSASVPDACPAGRRNRYLILTEDDFAAGGALRLCGKGGRGQQPPACARLPAGWCAPRPPALRSRAWPQRARRERRRARADACARAQVLQHVVHGQQLAGRERGLRVRPRAPPPPPARPLPAARPLCSAPALGDSMLSAGRRKQGL
jgi:hypothetical protein